MPSIRHRLFITASTVLISVLILSPVVQASPISVSSDPAPKTDEKLLQLTSQGHVLGFREDGIYVASARHMLKVDFLDSNSVTPQADNAVSDVGTDKVQPLGRVTYDNAWDGVTVVYEASGSAVAKSTYYLDKDNHVERIRLGYNRPVQLDEQGNLVIAFENGTLTESAPIAWQEINGKRNPVEVAYVMNGDRELGFSLGRYVPGIPVVIDPDLTWNTFLGGSSGDSGNSIAVDVSGNVYVAGNSPTTWGTPIRAKSGSTDAAITKLDSNGNIIWHTFLGGSGSDNGNSIAVDVSGNVYVAGISAATWGTPTRAYTLGNDAFAAKLNSSGVLIWNTFLGGSGTDYGRSIAVDVSGNVYVAGDSSTTWGTPIRAYTLGTDAFVAKLDSSGTLLWNTFLGDSGNDIGGRAIAIDGSGNIYIAGTSDATWGTPIRAYTLNDAFAAKLNSSGALTWNTFLGGSSADTGLGIAVDVSGNVYISGDGCVWGSPVRAYSLGGDAFVAKLDSSGAVTWNTCLGGGGSDQGYSIAVDVSGNVYVAGRSNATWGTPTRVYSLGYDPFAAKLDSSGALTWNTFLGSSGTDQGYSIAVDVSGNVYVAGTSGATWGSPVRAYTAADDIYVAKLSNHTPVASAVSFTGTVNVGQLLTGTSTYSDADGDLQGVSTYRWLRNGSPISGATSLTYTLVSADAGTTITFEVTPVALAGVSPGTAVVSSGQVINSAPVASDVNITGTPNVGQILTGNYTYSDVDGDAQGTSTFRWLRDGSPISGATTTTYTMTNDDIGTTSTFEVIPVALTGTSPGVAVNSSGIDVVSTPGTTSYPPLISVRMVPSPLALPAGPGPVTYTYTLSNNGQITMSDVTLVDDTCTNTEYVSGDTNSNQLMETSEAWIYTCTVTLDRTTVNYATARGTGNGIATVDTAVGQVVVGLSVVPPLINIVKTPTPLALPFGGGTVAYTYAVTNPGSAPLNNVTVVDNTCSPVTRVSGDTNNNNELEVSETWVYLCTMNVPQSMTNTAIATGEANGLIASDTAIVTVVVESSPIPPLIHILKKADHVLLPATGGLVTFTYTVINPGTVPLENVTVTDDKCSQVHVVSGDANGNGVMDTFETWTYSCQQTLLVTTTNTATARGQANGLTATDTSVVSVVLVQSYVLPTGINLQLIKLACLNNDLNDACRTVYYVDISGKRHAFPNDKVYFTWYSNFDGIQTVSPSLLATLPLSSNITYKPGVRMVKFATDSKVYAVSKGGILRWVVSEAIAAALYGSFWNTMIDDIADAFHGDYGFGADIDSAGDYNPALTQASVSYPGNSLR